MSLIATYLEQAETKKYGGVWSVRYISPVDGKKKRISHKVSGRLASREDAEAWVALHLERILAIEIETAKRQEWRRASDIVKLASQYRAYKEKQAPRSWQQECSILENFVLPYFVVQADLKNPNKWHPEHQRFKAWLLDEAVTEKGGKIAVSTANKAINALNKFSEWMRDHARSVEWENCRSLKCYAQSMQARRGADDLVDDDEFTLLVAQLRADGEEVFADMVMVQRHTGMRVNELLGLSLLSLTKKVPEQVSEAYEKVTLWPIYGAIYLDSQPRDPYITRIEGEIPRGPLKWRDEISPRNARTIPITDKQIFNILVQRYNVQRENLSKLRFGPKKDSYLLFDGAQRNLYLTAIREAYEKFGLRYKGSHVLRHTRATELTMLGLPDKIQELVMGHKGMAQQRYQHIVEVLNRKTQQAIDLEEIAEVV